MDSVITHNKDICVQSGIYPMYEICPLTSPSPDEVCQVQIRQIKLWPG